MTVPLLAAGDLVITAFAVVVAGYEGWLFLRRRKPVHGIATTIALATAVFATAAAVQYGTVDPSYIQTIARIEFVALVALALAVAELAAAATGLRFPIPRLLGRVFGLAAALLVVATELIVPRGTVTLDVWFLDHPYLQPQTGPLTTVFFAACIVFSALAAGWIVWKAPSRDVRLFIGVSVVVWLVAAIVDAMASAGLLHSTPMFVMEYGFFLLAGSLMAADVRHYGQLLERSEELQQQSEASFRRLIERVPISTMVYVEDRIVYANSAALQTLGFDRLEELLGLSAIDLVHPDDRPGAEERTKQILQADRPVAMREERLRRRDGSYVAVESVGVPVVFQGKLGVAAIGMDITERKTLTAKIMQMDRMIAVGTLAAGVAHEINNPLTYVIANVEYAARTLPELVGALRRVAGDGDAVAGDVRIGSREPDVLDNLDDLQQALGDARHGGERVRRIVGDLLVFSRGEQNALAPVALPQVIESSVSMAWNEIKHRARLVKELDPVPRVVANESRLGQVFLNLLVNAAQSIPEGQAGKNEIRVITRTSATGAAVAEVRDTGCGIPADLLGRVFDPFFTTKPVGQGTGLGLSICQGIVRELGGDITVKSDVGHGTVFRVTLPAAPAVFPDSVPVEAAAPVVAPRRDRVLVIDDEENVGSVIRRVLGSDYEVVTLTSARTALAKLDAGETFNLILCDLMMPEVTGMEFFAEVGRRHQQVQDRIVFITGGVLAPRVREFLDAVPNQRMEKPFELESLRAVVRDALR